MTQPMGQIIKMVQPGAVALQSYEVPDPGPGEVLLRMVRANVCGSELHYWAGRNPQVRAGGLGHEGIGRVEALGQGVSTDNAGSPLSPGDLVTFTYFVVCQRCQSCRRGLFHLCENGYQWWRKQPEESPHFHATFATHYLVHRDQHVYRVPTGISDYVAASANCAVAQMLFGLDTVGPRPGDVLVIQGLGGLGLYGVAMAKQRAARVIAVDLVDGRLELARRFGADVVVNRAHESEEDLRDAVHALSGGYGADAVIDVTGVPESLTTGLALVHPGGQVLEIGNVSPGRAAELDPGALTRRAVRLQFLIRYPPWYLHKALEFLAETAQQFPYAALESASYALDDVQAALDQSARREVVRASIVM